MHNLKTIAFLLVATLLLALPAIAAAELVDRVVAIVNDDIITLSDLNREGQPLFRKISREAPPGRLDQAMLTAREQILGRLIDQRIVEQHAEKLGITVTDQEVSAAIERILKENHATRKDFLLQLKAIGTTEAEYRASLKNQILQSKLVNYEIRAKIVITDERVKAYYDKNYAARVRKGNYHILQLGFTWDNQDPNGRKEAKKQADRVRALAAAGKDFRELARQYSRLPSAEDGGDIGVFKKEELAPYMKKTILAMRPGEISPVVETPAGFQVFKLLSDQGDVSALAPFDSVKNKIRDLLYQQETKKQYEKWVTELRDQAYIKKLL